MFDIIESTPVTLGEKPFSKLNLEDIGRNVMEEGRVFCLKQCLRPQELDALRETVFQYYQNIPKVPVGYDENTSTLNYHSVEKGVSPFQKSLHYFHAYVFNRMDSLPPELQPHISKLFTSLLSVYNRLTQQERHLHAIHDDGRNLRSQIFQYPRGGGMFSTHIHPLQPQRIGLILALSKRGRDFQEGGAGFEAPDGSLVDTSDIQDIGDLLLFRYDLKHWVIPCDIECKLDENAGNGRWSAVMTLY